MIKQRVVWLDVLRIFSAFLIVCIHVSSHYVEKLLSYGSAGWVCADIYLALCRCAVPVFVMISGAVFLNPEKDISLKLIYRKYIWHMLTVLLAWASVHFVVVDVWLGQTPSASWGSVYFMSVVTYWFLPMIMGLYALSPVFRAVVLQSNKKLLAYSVGLGLVWGVLAPVAQAIQTQVSPDNFYLPTVITLIKTPLPVFCAHFLFGYYVYKYGLGRGVKTVLYVGAVLAVIAMAWGGYAFFDEKTSRFYYYSMHGASLSPLSFITGAAAFVLGKDLFVRVRVEGFRRILLENLASCCLGVYMLHIVLVQAAEHFNLFTWVRWWPGVTVPVVSLLMFAVSAGIVYLLGRSRFVRRYFL